MTPATLPAYRQRLANLDCEALGLAHLDAAAHDDSLAVQANDAEQAKRC